MAWICVLLCHLSLAISTLAIIPSQIKVFPENGGVSGVFLASLQPVQNKNHPYAFNASQAREVCLMLNVIIATRAQVEEAHRNGLETCRYGWVDEKIAVLPRITASQPCGLNRVGVIEWRSIPTRSFDAFCFNSSGIKTDPVSTTIPATLKSTTVPTTSKPRTIPTTSKRTTTPTTIPTTSKPTTIPTTFKPTTIPTTSKPTTIPTISKPTTIPTTSKPTTIPTTSKPKRTPTISSSATAAPPTYPVPQTTQSAPSSPPPPSFSSTLPPPLSSPRSRTPASSSDLSPSTPYHLPHTTSPVSPTSVPPSPTNTDSLQEAQDKSSSGSPLGVVPIVLLVVVAILSLLAAVIGLWYYKMNRCRIVPFWKSGQPKDDIETEVWENLCHQEVNEPYTGMELSGFSNDISKELSQEENSETHTDSP